MECANIANFKKDLLLLSFLYHIQNCIGRGGTTFLKDFPIVRGYE